MVDTDGYEEINKAALRTKYAVDTERWSEATLLWGSTEGAILQATNNIDFYNILTKIEPNNNQLSLMQRLVSEPTFAQGKNIIYYLI